MRIVFLYAADGQAANGTKPAWDENAQPTNALANGFPDEGYCAYLCELVRQPGSVDEVLVVVESTHGCGTAEIMAGVNIVVMPTIDYLPARLRPDDVIFCRHGFRTWFPFLTKCYEQGRWMLFYGANGGRERWRCWHIVFNDLIQADYFDDWGRLCIEFKKPVNTKVFYAVPDTPKKYDYMVGASHIHDKKGQWRAVAALSLHARRWGVCPPAILPGRAYRGEQSGRIADIVAIGRLNVEMPGMLSRRELAERMRQTKTFLHFGSGQGDRSVIEAGACGCNLIVCQPAYHNQAVLAAAHIIPANDFTLETAENATALKKATSAYFADTFGADKVAASHRPLFEFIATNRPEQASEYLNGRV